MIAYRYRSTHPISHNELRPLRNLLSKALLLLSLLTSGTHAAQVNSQEAIQNSSSSTAVEKNFARDLLSGRDENAELILGLMHHLGYGKIYDPELAAAWIHAAAYDGCATAGSILAAMQSPKTWTDPETGEQSLIINEIKDELSAYFQEIDQGGWVLNQEMARRWILDQALTGNPVALYNSHIAEAQDEQIHYLLTHVPAYYQRIKIGFDDAELDRLLSDWMAHPELYEHPDTWMFAFHNGLQSSGLGEHSLNKLRRAIEGGSLRATLYRLKFLNDSMLSESDSVLSNDEEIQQLLEQNYPPAWDVKCGRLLAELEALENVDDPEPYLSAIQAALRFGYEFNPLRLLGTLMSRSMDETIFQRGFEIFKKAASMGMPSAYYSLGFCYRNGFGTQQDIEKATHWFKKAEKHKDAAASYQLGWIMLAQNSDEDAFRHFETAAELGNESAQFKCGQMLMDGIGIEANKLQAYSWFEAAADQGNETASLFCAFFQENGWIGEKDLDQALYYYRKAVISQSEQSFTDFFRFLQERIHQPGSSMETMLMVADEVADWVPPEYLVNLGIVCWNHPFWPTRMKWDRANRYFEKAANRGNESGKLMARVLCIHGYPGHDANESVSFFKELLKRSEDTMDQRFRAQAVTALALAYLYGMGAPLDYEAYLDLLENQPIPETIKNQLDQEAQKSNAYKIFLQQADLSDRYRRARFTARKHPEQSPPEPVIQIEPQYPRYLKEMGIDGTVTVTMIIDTEGNIVAPMIEESSHSGFEEPAIRALAHWKFLPGLKNAEPVETRIRLPLVFRVK